MAETTLEVLDQGAMVLRWVPPGEQDVLFVGDPVRSGTIAPVHAGIPVVFPWFGGGPGGSLTPSHGFARTVAWRRVHDGSDGVELELAVDAASQATAYPVMPVPVRLGLSARPRGNRLEVALTMTNEGSDDVTVEAALHTYLRVGDVEQVSLSGLHHVRYLDKTAGPDEPRWPEQHGDLRIEGETDRIYLSTDPVTVER